MTSAAIPVPRPRYYVPDGAGGFRPAGLFEWAMWFDTTFEVPFRDGGQRVARDDLAGGVLVSTIFIGLDHNFLFDGPPILFETMILNSPDLDWQERHETLAEAEAGHARALEIAKDGQKPK
jgi:hypothetical protein